MPDIKCTVNECKYNNNVICGAPMIEVTVAAKLKSPKADGIA